MVLPSGDQRGVSSVSAPLVSWSSPVPLALTRQTWLMRRLAFQFGSDFVKTISLPSGESCGPLMVGMFMKSTSVIARWANAAEALQMSRRMV